MQTFLPFKDFKKCAECLDNKRLFKQIVECKQILETIRNIKERDDKLFISGQCESIPKPFPYENHPAVLMWKKHEYILRQYQLTMLDEWLKRRWDVRADIVWNNNERIDAYKWFKQTEGPAINKIKWLGDERLHKSHRANLYYKNTEHYKTFLQDYVDIVGYERSTCGDKPDYFWPVTKNKKYEI